MFQQSLKYLTNLEKADPTIRYQRSFSYTARVKKIIGKGDIWNHVSPRWLTQIIRVFFSKNHRICLNLVYAKMTLCQIFDCPRRVDRLRNARLTCMVHFGFMCVFCCIRTVPGLKWFKPISLVWKNISLNQWYKTTYNYTVFSTQSYHFSKQIWKMFLFLQIFR